MTEAYATSEGQALTFLQLVFGTLEDGWLAISTEDAGKLVTDYRSVGALDAAAEDWGDNPSSTWIGVASRAEAHPKWVRGTKAQCAAITGLWLDVDVHDPLAHKTTEGLPTTFADARAIIRQFPLPPSFVVHTGHGLQPWWLLDEPMAATDYEEALRRPWGRTWQTIVDRMNVKLREHGLPELARFDSVWNVDRMMRLPGTANTKVATEVPAPVVTLELPEGAVPCYGMADLEPHLVVPDELPPAGTHIKVTARAPREPGVVLAGDDFNTRHSAGEVLMRQGWAYDRPGPDGSELYLRPGKEKGDGHGAQVFADGFARIYSSTYHRDFPLTVDPDGEPVNLSPAALYAALVWPQERDLSAAMREAREALEANGYGTARPNVQAALDALVERSQAAPPTPRLTLVPGGAEGAVVALTPAEGEARDSWLPIDLLDVRREPADMRPRPSILPIRNGAGREVSGLFYPGKLHMTIGESESGKTWLCLVGCVEVLRAGGTVLYVDFEDDERSIEDRLTQLGVTDEQLARFIYVRPDEPLFTLTSSGVRPTERYNTFKRLVSARFDLVVFDGLNEALALHNLSMNQATEVAHLYNWILRPVAKDTGAAVVGIDHVAKGKDAGEFGHAIGSQHKRAATDVMLLVSVRRQFAKGIGGVSKVTVSKDRPGMLRAICPDDKHRELAELELSYNTAGVMAFAVRQATPPAEPGALDLTNPLTDRILAYVVANPGASARAIREAAGGNDHDGTVSALALLEKLGRVVAKPRAGRGGGMGWWPAEGVEHVGKGWDGDLTEGQEGPPEPPEEAAG